MNAQLDASYARCQAVARRSASSFYYSFLLLPKQKRMAMCALYAFLRRTDDLGDSNEPVESRRQSLIAWRQSLLAALDGRCDDPLLPALADTVSRFQIPLQYLDAVIDGVEMDLRPARYDTFQHLEQYCYRVASVVGLACLRIWECDRAEALVPAKQCGLAFQMTNILRDLKEDAARGRVYLPREDLKRFGYTSEELLSGVRDERLNRLLRFEIERAELFYEEAAELGGWLSPEAGRVFGSMTAVYRALLNKVKRLEGDVLLKRVRLSRWQKMRIATRWFLFPAAAPRAAAAIAP